MDNQATQRLNDLSLEPAPSHDEQDGSGLVIDIDQRKIGDEQAGVVVDDETPPLEQQDSHESLAADSRNANFSYHENQQLLENGTKQLALDEHDSP